MLPAPYTLLAVVTSALLIGGCTSTRVTPLQAAPDRMCIQENPKVKVRDFVPVLQQGFARHGISTELYAQIPWEHCSYVVTYTARRSWDMAPYLSSAEISVLGPRRQTLAQAHYHLRGKGGLSLMKWQGTQSKIDPLIDELLRTTRLDNGDKPTVKSANVPPSATNHVDRLRALQQQGLDYEDYQRAYRNLQQEGQGETPPR